MILLTYLIVNYGYIIEFLYHQLYIYAVQT